MHRPRPTPQVALQSLLVWHMTGQQPPAFAVEVVVAAKPRSSREIQSRKAFFMRQFSFMSLRQGSSLPHFSGCFAGGHRDSALATFQLRTGYQPSG
jgi:hypothetical protein